MTEEPKIIDVNKVRTEALVNKLGPANLADIIRTYTGVVFTPNSSAVSDELRLKQKRFEELVAEFNMSLSDRWEQADRLKLLGINRCGVGIVKPDSFTLKEMMLYMAPYFHNLKVREKLIKLLFFSFDKYTLTGIKDVLNAINGSFDNEYNAHIASHKTAGKFFYGRYQTNIKAVMEQYCSSNFAFMSMALSRLPQNMLWISGVEDRVYVGRRFMNRLELLKSFSYFYGVFNYAKYTPNAIAACIAYINPHLLRGTKPHIIRRRIKKAKKDF